MHGDSVVIVGSVAHRQIVCATERRCLLLQPRHIWLDPRGVDDEQENIFGQAVGVEIVNHATALIAHERVLAEAGREFADVVRENLVQKLRSRRAAHGNFTHVRDVENPGGIAHGEMFIRDTRVLHGHFPTAELDKFAAKLLVGFVKRCAF